VNQILQREEKRIFSGGGGEKKKVWPGIQGRKKLQESLSSTEMQKKPQPFQQKAKKKKTFSLPELQKLKDRIHRGGRRTKVGASGKVRKRRTLSLGPNNKKIRRGGG